MGLARPVTYVAHPDGRRCYVLGRRFHHGLAGLMLVGAGLALAWHDRRDWPFLSDGP